MSRHRRRPARRPLVRARRGQAPRSRPRRPRLSAAARRVVVSPTFAAGLGVVIAALLAYPVSQLSLQYARPKGQPCPQRGCAVPSGSGVGSLASAPVRRLNTHPPRRPRHSHSPSPSPSPSPVPGGGPLVTYQTVRRGDGGFVAELVITPDAPVPAKGWQLRIRFRHGQIRGVWGGNWTPRGRHGVVITQASEWSPPGGSGIRIFLAVAGRPGSPARCRFDGQDCRIRVVSGPGGYGGWGQ